MKEIRDVYVPGATRTEDSIPMPAYDRNHCWFCGSLADADCRMQIPLIRGSRPGLLPTPSSIPLRWNEMVVDIPRCEGCSKFHQQKREEAAEEAADALSGFAQSMLPVVLLGALYYFDKHKYDELKALIDAEKAPDALLFFLFWLLSFALIAYLRGRSKPTAQGSRLKSDRKPSDYYKKHPIIVHFRKMKYRVDSGRLIESGRGLDE